MPTADDPWEFDPRPDLSRDSKMWDHLLMLVRATENTAAPDSLFGALHGLRCLGARLVVRGGRVRLSAGEIDDEEYERLRAQWLAPHHEKLIRMLDNLDRWAA